MAMKYAAFRRAAGLGEATVRRFEQLLLDREAQESDLWAIARETPPGDRFEMVPVPRSDGVASEVKMDPAVAAIRRQQIAQFEAEQVALLGEAGYRRLLEFQRDEGKRLVVSQLVSDLTLSDSPLTPNQSGQLAAALKAVDFGGKQTPGVAEWREILARTQNLLSAPQLAALKKQAAKADHAAAMAALTKLVEQESQRAGERP
jgi:hypothetical protein